MKGKTKKSIIVLIVLLSIGFAAVTTTLTINGTIRLGANQSNFENNLVFTKASLTYSDTTKTGVENVTGAGAEGDPLRIIDNGKGISFTTDTLKNIGETATLTYDITNNSQYVAEFTGITCTVTNAANEDVTASVTGGTEYITLNAGDFKEQKEGATERTNIKLAKTETLAGRTLVVTLRKSYVGTAADGSDATTQYTVNCSIAASGLSE